MADVLTVLFVIGMIFNVIFSAKKKKEAEEKRRKERSTPGQAPGVPAHSSPGRTKRSAAPMPKPVETVPATDPDEDKPRRGFFGLPEGTDDDWDPLKELFGEVKKQFAEVREKTQQEAEAPPRPVRRVRRKAEPQTGPTRSTGSRQVAPEGAIQDTSPRQAQRPSKSVVSPAQAHRKSLGRQLQPEKPTKSSLAASLSGDGLRKAILMAEILGPPLAKRPGRVGGPGRPGAQP